MGGRDAGDANARDDATGDGRWAMGDVGVDVGARDRAFFFTSARARVGGCARARATGSDAASTTHSRRPIDRSTVHRARRGRSRPRSSARRATARAGYFAPVRRARSTEARRRARRWIPIVASRDVDS